LSSADIVVSSVEFTLLCCPSRCVCFAHGLLYEVLPPDVDAEVGKVTAVDVVPVFAPGVPLVSVVSVQQSRWGVGSK
jgi:hypothetical protein